MARLSQVTLPFRWPLVGQRRINQFHSGHFNLHGRGLVLGVDSGIDQRIVRDFPRLWQPTDEYTALQGIIENILLVAIAAELSLLLLFHKTTAAVEVVMFIIARKMVNPTVTALDLLLGATALAGLIIVRFYYLPETQNN